ncbi:MAG TPA: PIG-L family deacetylase [Streptosporangiaceae bacterium]|nr:PIG-L family deacetylase [Streptosporangiaceae bacterium]
MSDIRLLAIGAHPDDIEIGSAALVSKAVDSGIEVNFLILTDDGDDRDARRAEATLAAEALGVPPDHVMFAGLPDGRLRADAESVSLVREIVLARNLSPQLIVTHTLADSHNDHVEANRIAHAAFRGCIFLHYSIHLSREQDRFAPRIFVEVSGSRLDRKAKALALHNSQRARLERRDLSEYEASLGKLAQLDRAEAFEVSLQEGSAGLFDRVLALSESPFHRFWERIIDNKNITLFYEAYTAPGAPIDWPTTHENAGRDLLRQAFRDQWLPNSPLTETPSSSSTLQQILDTQSVILAGGAVSNVVVRDLYNRFRSTLWAIEYEMPRLEPAYLYNRATGVRFYPEYDSGRSVLKDFGVIARVANPYARAEHILCAAGAGGLGTRVALEFLANPGAERDIAKCFEARGNVQVAFSVKPETGKIKVLDVHSEQPGSD